MDARAYWHVCGCAEDCEFSDSDGGCEAQTDNCSCTTWDLCVAAATKDDEIERLRVELHDPHPGRRAGVDIEVEPVNETKTLDLAGTLVWHLHDGPRTRDELVEITGAPRTTIHDAIKVLESAGRVHRYPDPVPTGCRGRPKVLFALQEEVDEQ